MVKVNRFKSHELSKLLSSFKPNCLIVVTHPSCGHCGRFRPIKERFYNELENNYEGDSEVFDIHGHLLEDAKNEIPPLNYVHGYPTILANKDTDNNIEYNGDRTVDNLLRFMKENFELKKKQNGGKKSKKHKKSKKNKKSKKHNKNKKSKKHKK